MQVGGAVDASRWFELDVERAARELETDIVRGLPPEEAARRLAQHGPNELTESGARPLWAIALDQLRATMVLVLIVAATVSALLSDYTDAVAILAIVALNAALGFIQEYRAEMAMAALKRLAVPHVRARRGGGVLDLDARDLVPGDLVLLEAGNLVPADARIVDSVNLRTQEAALTGESAPIDKASQALPPGDVPLAERRNMTFMGTVVVYGRGAAIVTATGMGTELGRIAAMLQSVGREPTPLQRRLDQLGRQLAVVALAIVAVIFGLGLARGEDLRVMFLTAVSMAVAAVPEGLPAVVTIALALGAQRMLRRQALIRKLAAVEALGSVTVICSDKTGTLTANRMTVAALDVAGRQVRVEEGRVPDAGLDEATVLLLAGLALCSDVNDAGGDPTEAALVDAAARASLPKTELDVRFPRIGEAPFDAERKRMTTVHALPPAADEGDPVAAPLRRAARARGASHVVFTKGAVERLLDVSTGVWVQGAVRPLDGEWRGRIVSAHDGFAGDGMRVLGLALRLLDEAPAASTGPAIEDRMVFVGMAAIVDPPRTDAKAAVETCRAAGVRPVMITGDHPLTARHVARHLGIDVAGAVVAGSELDQLADEAIEAMALERTVYARVSPEHKLRIVGALQRRRQIVAMTGDGVNDAPALRKADIGVAMGITGSDVSKEAADIVLLDDNFATIVAAVEEGRVIYDNVRKFVKYLLTTNSAELWLMLAAPFLGMGLPLLPLQILWINLVTDGPPALTLGVEPAERGVMRRPPYPPGESVFARGLGAHVLWVGLLMAGLTLGVGHWYWQSRDAAFQTVVFTTLAFAQMAHVLAIRSERDSLFQLGLGSNLYLTAAVALTLTAQVAVVYVPSLQRIFGTVPLAAEHLATSAGVAVVVFAAVELEKWRVRRRGA
jgi:Ca2+-transporting ATPase